MFFVSSYRPLCKLKTIPGDVKQLELDFTIVHSNFGESQVVDLKPNGASIPVTEANKIEYVHLVANYKLNRQVSRLSSYVNLVTSGIDSIKLHEI